MKAGRIHRLGAALAASKADQQDAATKGITFGGAARRYIDA